MTNNPRQLHVEAVTDRPVAFLHHCQHKSEMDVDSLKAAVAQGQTCREADAHQWGSSATEHHCKSSKLTM